jgi:hypothetical protein
MKLNTSVNATCASPEYIACKDRIIPQQQYHAGSFIHYLLGLLAAHRRAALQHDMADFRSVSSYWDVGYIDDMSTLAVRYIHTDAPYRQSGHKTYS